MWYFILKNMIYDKIIYRVMVNILWIVLFNMLYIKNYVVVWEVVNNDFNNRNLVGYENYIII